MSNRQIQRGVVALPAIIEIQGESVLLRGPLSPQDLAYYFLYWDKIVVPRSNIIHVEMKNEETLIQTGVFSRPRVQLSGPFYGAELGHTFAMAQAETIKSLIAEDTSTEWTIHQFGPSLYVPREFAEEKRILRFELSSLLPVPSADVPIPDILEFKERRRDEFGNLHQCLDDAYLEVLRSPDKELSKKIAMSNLDAAIASLNAVSTESWKKTTKYDFSVDLSADGGRILQGIMAGAVFDFFLNGMTVPMATIAGGVASLLKITAKASRVFEPARAELKLSYLSQAHNERIIS